MKNRKASWREAQLLAITPLRLSPLAARPALFLSYVWVELSGECDTLLFFCFPSADWFLSLGPFTLRSHLSNKCDWLKLSNNYTWQIIVLCANLLWAIKKDASNKSRDEKDTCSFVLILVIGWPGGKKSVCMSSNLAWLLAIKTHGYLLHPTSRTQKPFKVETLLRTRSTI